MAEPWTRGGVLVTGGTGALGLEIAREFLERGARVVVAGASASGERRAREALSPYGAQSHVITADLRDLAALRRMLGQFEELLGPVAVLVNCAGVNYNRSIAEVSPEDYDAVMALNVRAAFFTSQWAGARMAAVQIPGRIVNVTSGNYRYARPNAALYAASKAALEMLTRAFALELGEHGITVNAVAPGLVAKDAPAGADFDRVAGFYRANAALGRIIEPREVAAAVAFLASAAAGAITGDTIVVDGGFSAGRLDFPRRTQQR